MKISSLWPILVCSLVLLSVSGRCYAQEPNAAPTKVGGEWPQGLSFTPVPLKPGEVGGPYPCISPCPTPIAGPNPPPSMTQPPSGYSVVPQFFPLPVASPTPTATPQPESFWEMLKNALAALDPATPAFACEYTQPPYDCDNPASISTQFEGGGSGHDTSTTFWTPPDTDGAVGNNYALTFLNGALYIRNLTGALISSQSATTFWCSHYSLPNGCNPIDPRLVHDNSDTRWIASSLAGTGTAAVQTLLAVSPGEDPTSPQNWYFYNVQSCADGSPGDQPRLGFIGGYTGKWIVLFVDCANGHNRVWVFDKAKLYAHQSLSGASFAFAGSASFQQPAVQAAGLTEFLVGVNDPVVYCGPPPSFGCFQSLTFNSLAIGTITGSVDAPTYTPKAYTITLPTTGNINAPPGYQQGSPVLVGTEQALVNSAFGQLVNGYFLLFAAVAAGLPASAPYHSGIIWAQMNDLGSLVKSGVIQDTSGVNWASYHYPSIAVNGYGDGILGFADFSINYYPRADYELLDFETGTPDEDSSYPVAVLVTSQAPWTGGTCICDGVRCNPNGTYTCARWGDYSSTVLSPDGLDIWTLQEYTNLSPTPPPALASQAPAAAPTPGPQQIQDTWWAEILP
jgi:hypothetical protein